MEGYLLLWTNYLYGWKKKYFTIKGSTLHYSSDKNKVFQYSLSLDLAQASVHKNSKRFIITSPEATLHLKALSTKESKSWVELLNTSKSDARTLAHNQEASIGAEIAAPNLILSNISRLWSLQETIEQLSLQLPKDFRESHNSISSLINSTNEFKKLALDTANLIEDQHQQLNKLQEEIDHSQGDRIEPIVISARNTMDEFIMGRLSELSDSPRNAIFLDARSRLSGDSFEDVKSHLSYSQNLFHRNTLPVLRNPNLQTDLWKAIKNYVIKDLSKIPFPISFFEPLSFLQRLSEDMTYSEILVRAAESEDPLLRLALVACFSISCYSSTYCREMKPFTPLIGETFDLERDGFSYLAEQIAFQPPMSAWHCSHDKFSYSGWITITNKFKGTYLKVIPKGYSQVSLPAFQETYTWDKLPINVHNIIVGDIYLDHSGKYECRNPQNNAKAVINIRKRAWFGQKKHYVEGSVMDSTGKSCYKIFGKWSERIIIKSERTGQEILGYEIQPNPNGFRENYFFSEFAMQLNIPPEFAPGICPTDSRYRPDVRALENGDIESALKIKNVLEESQEYNQSRETSRSEEKSPKWFRFSSGNWEFGREYWDQKSLGKFSKECNIFNI